MAQHTHKELFLDSLNRCAADNGFISAFYKRFLNSSDEVRRKFRFTDFKKQEAMLLGSLRLIAGATAGDSEALHELRERATTHDRYHLNIKAELYDLWLAAIVDTAKEFDPQWSAEVEESWHTILGHVVQHMVRHY